MKRYPLFISLVGLLALAAGCTSFGKTAFQAEWKRHRSGPNTGITGCWAGSWQNTNNSHGGKLWAVIIQNSGTEYAARFEATWGEKSGSFKTKLKGRQEGDDFVFEGRKRIMGFLITTRGRANGTNFFSTYESRFDTGTFTLGRP
jgi:hypothetical protein